LDPLNSSYPKIADLPSFPWEIDGGISLLLLPASVLATDDLYCQGDNIRLKRRRLGDNLFLLLLLHGKQTDDVTFLFSPIQCCQMQM
jgi:hypothetical protein